MKHKPPSVPCASPHLLSNSLRPHGVTTSDACATWEKRLALVQPNPRWCFREAEAELNFSDPDVDHRGLPTYTIYGSSTIYLPVVRSVGAVDVSSLTRFTDRVLAGVGLCTELSPCDPRGYETFPWQPVLPRLSLGKLRHRIIEHTCALACVKCI